MVCYCGKPLYQSQAVQHLRKLLCGCRRGRHCSMCIGTAGVFRPIGRGNMSQCVQTVHRLLKLFRLPAPPPVQPVFS